MHHKNISVFKNISASMKCLNLLKDFWSIFPIEIFFKVFIKELQAMNQTKSLLGEIRFKKNRCS